MLTDLRPSDASERIEALVDDDDKEDTHVHGVFIAGENDEVWYVLAVMERRYEDETYLNERYAMLTKDGSMEDTFLKNGINRRFNADMATALADIYAAIDHRRERNRNGIDQKPMFHYLDSETVDFAGDDDG